MARVPGRPGFFRRLPLPSRREGLVVLVLLLVTAAAVGASAWYASTRQPPAYQPREDAAASPTSRAPSPSAAPATSAPTTSAPPVLAVYGDWFVAGTDRGGLGDAGWQAVLSGRVGARLATPHAATDAGYTAASAGTGDTFATLAENAPEPDADVTIVFGGRNDYRAPPDEITAAAGRTFDAIRTAAPGTRLLVIGPAWTGADVPPELLPVRDAVQRAAEPAGATFVDPLAEGWFADGTGLVADDLISPTDAGHRYLADRIEQVVRRLLAESP
ncbi:SGNH/GDSL hydrolase family protein [Blastococcus sp. SYSU D00922]